MRSSMRLCCGGFGVKAAAFASSSSWREREHEGSHDEGRREEQRW